MKEIIFWKDQEYEVEWFEDTDFEKLENPTQAYGLIFDNNQNICIINCRHNEDGWCLPGGGIEDYDENFEATLIREVDEEADLDIKEIKRIGHFKVTPISENCQRKEIHHLLRYVAIVDKIKEQTIDPAHNKIPLRKFIHTKDFDKIVNWGKTGEIQLKKALEKLK
jgi:ADP-ribose pyrophosphatase YjhB (NUDIX family)